MSVPLFYILYSHRYRYYCIFNILYIHIINFLTEKKDFITLITLKKSSEGHRYFISSFFFLHFRLSFLPFFSHQNQKSRLGGLLIIFYEHHGSDFDIMIHADFSRRFSVSFPSFLFSIVFIFERFSNGCWFMIEKKFLV